MLSSVIIGCALAAYSRSFGVGFLYDDISSIPGNPTIRHLGTAMLPPAYATVTGRPLVNVSLAVNYMVGGLGVWGYHAFNTAVLVLGALALFGIVRRTARPALGQASDFLAFSSALLWAVHPLLTESVTYIIQRAESLMGLAYLLTLYSFIRGSRGQRGWLGVSLVSCALGMATKEVMVTAPLVVLLYDRTFVAGGFRRALAARPLYYLSLAATWAIVAVLVAGSGGRSGTAGFGAGVSWQGYAIVQVGAVIHYLRLCFFPYPLVFDYGRYLAVAPVEVLPAAVLLAALLAATAWAVVRRPALGFLGASFFLILAPSSSIMPVATECMAEHRMYLPLAAVCVGFVLALRRLFGRAATPVCVASAAALMVATFHRNEAYLSAVGLWSETVALKPQNERARNYLGIEYAAMPGRAGDAVAQFQEALRLRPDFPEAHYNLARAWTRSAGRDADAIAQYEEALREDPGYSEAHNNLGCVLAREGRAEEAISQFREAVRESPGYSEAHCNLGAALRGARDVDGAITEYQDAVRLAPASFEAHLGLASALLAKGRPADAVGEFRLAVRLMPGDVGARHGLASALDASGHPGEAEAEFTDAIRMSPGDAGLHRDLGVALARQPGRIEAAAGELQQAIRLAPSEPDAHFDLACIWSSRPDHAEDAIAEFREAYRLKPDPETQYLLGVALLAVPGRRSEAAAQFEAVLRVDPGNAAAREKLGAATSP
jgi:tetratricopeptide (TPR) repeat protein